MRRAATLFVLLALLALLPLRGLAAVTIGFCAVAHAGATVQAQADHDHAVHPHGGETPDSDLNADCNACAEHCTSASVLLALPATLAGTFGAERVVMAEYFAAGHVPEHLDPPPLAL